MRPQAIGAFACPFCGSDDIRVSESKILHNGRFLKDGLSLKLFCSACGVNTGDNIYPTSDAHGKVKAYEKALTNWNKRAE